MSVRRRKWVSRKGEEREAWIVQYLDQDGVDRIKTFARKKDADDYHAVVRIDVGKGCIPATRRQLPKPERNGWWTPKTA
jgi:integrase